MSNETGSSSYWDLLPEEIRQYILKLREDMYRDDHRDTYRFVLHDVCRLHLVKLRVGLYHVKIQSRCRYKTQDTRYKIQDARYKIHGKANEYHNFICGENTVKRMISGYFTDGEGYVREVWLANCLCELDAYAEERARNTMENRWWRCRLVLYYDEWCDSDIADNYYVPGVLANAREKKIRKI